VDWATIATVATITTIYGGLVGQTIFVGGYLTRPWWRYRITRALMLKSIAFWLIFVRSAFLLQTRGMRPNEDTVDVIIFTLVLDAVILWAVWYQAIALLIEIGSQKKRDDSYIDPPHPGLTQ
jgi:hypothetical protein